MTSSAISGMTLEQAQEFVRGKAEQALEGNDSAVGIWTETGNRSVLVGIARRGQASATMLIPRSEYDGLKLLQMLGVGLG